MINIKSKLQTSYNLGKNQPQINKVTLLSCLFVVDWLGDCKTVNYLNEHLNAHFTYRKTERKL